MDKGIMELSFLPIDVGFDLRVTRQRIYLASLAEFDPVRIRYLDRHDVPQTRLTIRDHAARILRNAGYSVRVSQ
jgi:hypothetical protein